MLSVDEALEAILESVSPLVPELRPLGEARGLVLADDVLSDIDSPPFDKALMDGYAVKADDIEAGVELAIIERIMAGQVPQLPIEHGQATLVMTGAPLPEGADAVVKIEDTTTSDARDRVSISAPSARAEQNIIRRGVAMRRGERVVAAGRVLRAQEVAALAEMGQSEVSVRRPPRVAVLATGDELVPVAQTPGAGQIRNSNETMLVAQIEQAGGDPMPLGIARDDVDSLSQKIHAGLEADVLLLSGGVSAGQLDLVPQELNRAGVRERFHKVRVKPGKPVWFGATSDGSCFVFGLPGNPVSSMVCFELFVRVALRTLMGTIPSQPQPLTARLTESRSIRSDRPIYHPANLQWTGGQVEVSPVTWQGSSDLQATVRANSMVCFPAGDREFAKGTLMDVFPWQTSPGNEA